VQFEPTRFGESTLAPGCVIASCSQAPEGEGLAGSRPPSPVSCIGTWSVATRVTQSVEAAPRSVGVESAACAVTRAVPAQSTRRPRRTEQAHPGPPKKPSNASSRPCLGSTWPMHDKYPRERLDDGAKSASACCASHLPRIFKAASKAAYTYTIDVIAVHRELAPKALPQSGQRGTGEWLGIRRFLVGAARVKDSRGEATRVERRIDFGSQVARVAPCRVGQFVRCRTPTPGTHCDAMRTRDPPHANSVTQNPQDIRFAMCGK
jgi:hypothetical protein